MSQPLFKNDMSAFLYASLRFRICQFNEKVILCGPILASLILTCFFLIHLRAIVITALYKLSAYVSTLSFLSVFCGISEAFKS